MSKKYINFDLFLISKISHYLEFTSNYHDLIQKTKENMKGVKDSIDDLLRSISKKKTSNGKLNSSSINVWKCLEKVTETTKILNYIKTKYLSNQPTLDQIKQREEDDKKRPFSLIIENGKPGLGIGQKFFVDLSRIPKKYLKDRILQFNVNTHVKEKPKFP